MYVVCLQIMSWQYFILVEILGDIVRVGGYVGIIYVLREYV